jgi:hypothetical protein
MSMFSFDTVQALRRLWTLPFDRWRKAEVPSMIDKPPYAPNTSEIAVQSAGATASSIKCT